MHLQFYSAILTYYQAEMYCFLVELCIYLQNYSGKVGS